jgi:hypothetical protein
MKPDAARLAAHPALPFTDPRWNVAAFVRLECGIDDRERPILTHGQILYVPNDDVARVLFAFDHLEVRRARASDGGAYETIKSVAYLPRDPVTGEFVDEHAHPGSGRRERISLFSTRGTRMRYAPSGLRWLTMQMQPDEVVTPFRLVWSTQGERTIGTLNFSLWVPDEVGGRLRVETISETMECDTGELAGDAPYVAARVSHTLLCDAWPDPVTGDANARLLITRAGTTLPSVDALPSALTREFDARFPGLLEPLSWG